MKEESRKAQERQGVGGMSDYGQWWKVPQKLQIPPKLRICSLFVWLVADGWCWFVVREKYCWLVAGGWFVLREKYCWLVADKLNEQAVSGGGD
jgi:hypothetical protein